MSPPAAGQDPSTEVQDAAAPAEAPEADLSDAPAGVLIGAVDELPAPRTVLEEVSEGSITPEETELPPLSAADATLPLRDVAAEGAPEPAAVVQEEAPEQVDAPATAALAPIDAAPDAPAPMVEEPALAPAEPTAAADAEEQSVQGLESVDAEVKEGTSPVEAAAAGGKKKPKKKRGGKK
jgi:hypothetical protein